MCMGVVYTALAESARTSAKVLGQPRFASVEKLTGRVRPRATRRFWMVSGEKSDRPFGSFSIMVSACDGGCSLPNPQTARLVLWCSGSVPPR